MKLIIVCVLFTSWSLFAARTFMQEANERSQSLMKEILKNPFLLELKAGVLPKDKFDYFRHQDEIYNYRYSKSLTVLSSKSPIVKISNFLQRASLDTMREWKGPLPDDMTQCPDCFAYSNYEERSVQTSFNLGLAAIAPCYFVYWTVANTIANGVDKSNPYYSWIKEYSDPKFGRYVDELESMINEIAVNLSEVEWQKMQDAYQRSVHYELLFWTSAYNLATWSPR